MSVGAVVLLLLASHVVAFTAGAYAEIIARRHVTAELFETPEADRRGEDA